MTKIANDCQYERLDFAKAGPAPGAGDGGFLHIVDAFPTKVGIQPEMEAESAIGVVENVRDGPGSSPGPAFAGETLERLEKLRMNVGLPSQE
jgi:hypothetical protein